MLCPAMGVLPVPAGPPSIVRLQLLLSHISSGSSFGAVPGCPGKGQLLPAEFGVYCGTFLAQPGTPCQWLEQDLAPGQAFPLAARHKWDALLTLKCRLQSLLPALREHNGASSVSRAPLAFLAFRHVTAHLILSKEMDWAFFASFSQRGGLQSVPFRTQQGAVHQEVIYGTCWVPCRSVSSSRRCTVGTWTRGRWRRRSSSTCCTSRSSTIRFFISRFR